MSLCNVNLATGDVYHFSVDAHCRSASPMRFVRSYDSGLGTTSVLGWNWTHNRVRHLLLSGSTATYYRPFEDLVTIPLAPQDAPKGLQLTVFRDRATLKDGANNHFEFVRLSHRSQKMWLVSRLDPWGHLIRYEYAGEGLLHRISHSSGISFDLSLSATGLVRRLSAVVQEKSIELAQYEYSGDGDLVLAVTEQGHSTHGFEYRGHRMRVHTNPLGGQTFFEYDQQGRCVHTVRSDGRDERLLRWHKDNTSLEVRSSRDLIVKYTFSPPGRVATEEDFNGQLKKYVYDDNGLLQFIDSPGEPSHTTLYFSETGMLVEQHGDLTQTARYDAGQRLVESVSPCGAHWKYEYDDRSNRTAAIDTRGNKWDFQYDANGRLDLMTDPRGYRYFIRRPTANSVLLEDAIGIDSVAQFDPLGKVTSITDGASNTTNYTYLASYLAGVTYADGSTVSFTYDASGNLIETRDELGGTVRTEYTLFGAPTVVVDELGRSSTFSYDEENRLTAITNAAGDTAEMVYGGDNSLTKLSLFDGHSETYVRDSRGLMVEIRDQNDDLIVSVERDQMGRIVRAKYPDKTETNYVRGSQGQLLEVENSTCKVAFEWTTDLRIASETVGDSLTSYEYDEVGNRKSMRTSAGREVSYRWDARNRLTHLVEKGGAQYGFEYDEANMCSAWRCPSSIQKFQFDSRLRMISRSVESLNGTQLSSRRFEYDQGSRLVACADSNRGTSLFEYYANGALRAVRRAIGEPDEQYEYDRHDNLVRSPSGFHSYIRGDRVVSIGNVRFSYDSFGRMTSSDDPQNGRKEFRYNSVGCLSQAVLPDGSVFKYEYDAFGRRIRKVGPSGTTHFSWDMNAYQGEWQGEVQIDYLFLPGTFLPLGATVGARHYSYVLDHLGTPVGFVNMAGIMTQMQSPQAFGFYDVPHNVPSFVPFRFQGQYFDPETALHYNISRYYDPRVARYLTPDLIGLRGGSNVYRYSINPTRYVDPFGLLLAGGVLTIVPICGWSDAQMKDAEKKMLAMNSKIPPGGQPINEPQQRCGKTAKKIYQDCQDGMAQKGKPLPDLNESDDKCSNEQADHMLEICAGGGEKDCENLQPLNESVNKSFGSQVGKAVRDNMNIGATLTEVVLLPKYNEEGEKICRDNDNVKC